MGLSSRVRRLALSRAPGGSAGNVDWSKVPLQKRPSICWTSPVELVDRKRLRAGQRVILDVTITKYTPPINEATSIERVTSDLEELGKVLAWDGRVIGVVRVSAKGAAVYDFAWPADLASVAPVRAGA